MRTLYSLILFILLSVNQAYGAAATVATVDELFAAVAGSSTPIHLNAPDFNLGDKTGGGSDLTLNYNCTVDIAYDGNVVISGGNLYNVRVTNATVTLGNASGSHRLTICEGDAINVQVTASTAATTLNLYYCDINNSYTGNGVQVDGNPSHNATINAWYCKSFYNNADGFSLFSGNSNNVIEQLNLYYCEAYNNGTNDGSSLDQGATIHTAGHFLYILGGSYHDNNDQGVASAGGVVCIENATMRDCNVACIDIQGSRGTIMGCTLLSKASCYAINVTSSAYIKGNTICDLTDTGSSLIMSPGSSLIENNFIRGGGATTYALYLTGIAFINNNIFYDNGRPIRAQNIGIYVRNNVFYHSNSWCIYDVTLDGAFYYDKGNRKNYFYDSQSNITYATNHTDKAEDVIGVNPLITNIDTNDPTPARSSPLWNAGTASWGDVNSNIGVVQNERQKNAIVIER